jgi:Ca2+-transporting ATPase
VAAEAFYLLTISQCLPSLWAWKSDRHQPVAYIPLIGIGCVLLFQVVFSQIPWINPLFATQPISLVQSLLCVGVGIFVIVPSLSVKRWL